MEPSESASADTLQAITGTRVLCAWHKHSGQTAHRPYRKRATFWAKQWWAWPNTSYELGTSRTNCLIFGPATFILSLLDLLFYKIDIASTSRTSLQCCRPQSGHSPSRGFRAQPGANPPTHTSTDVYSKNGARIGRWYALQGLGIPR